MLYESFGVSKTRLRGQIRSIPTLASIRKWLEEAKLESLAGQVCMKLCVE